MSSNEDYGHFLAELNSAKFQALRPAQERVLGEYLDKFEGAADVAVELPMGAGKTLIALLIAENRRRNGHKVPYCRRTKHWPGRCCRSLRNWDSHPS